MVPRTILLTHGEYKFREDSVGWWTTRGSLLSHPWDTNGHLWLRERLVYKNYLYFKSQDPQGWEIQTNLHQQAHLDRSEHHHSRLRGPSPTHPTSEGNVLFSKHLQGNLIKNQGQYKQGCPEDAIVIVLLKDA